MNQYKNDRNVTENDLEMVKLIEARYVRRESPGDSRDQLLRLARLLYVVSKDRQIC